MMFSDEDIAAYLDAELEAERIAEFEKLRASSPEFARRVAAMEVDILAVRAAFSPLLAQAPAYTAPPAKRPWAWAGAAAAVVLLALGIGYSQFAKPDVEAWQMEVAHYQALYVPETVAVISPDPVRIKQELARAEGLLGIELGYAGLSNVPGLTLLRAQVLGYEGRSLIQIVYASEDGTPVAFCILNGADGTVSETGFVRLLGMDSALWQGPAHGFMVIGGQNPELISNAARYLRQLL